MLVLHELHHVLLGHTRLFRRVTPLDNLAFDAVINALLCRMFPGRDHTAFFTDFYADDQFPACLLRPPCGWQPGAVAAIPPALENRRTGAGAACLPSAVFEHGRRLLRTAGGAQGGLRARRL